MSQYVVKAGDNLWDIAEKLLGDGHRHEEIQRINNLTSADIRPGQILMIPGQGHGATNHVTTSHSNISHGNTSISKDEFDTALTSNNYPVQHRKYDYFIQSIDDASIATKSEAAMYLATLLHESSGLRVTKENPNSESNRAYGTYIGRGYIQLSSEANYRAASHDLGEDYVTYPDSVSQDPHAWNVSAWYWKNQVHQHVKNGFTATVTHGIRPLEPHIHERKIIYGNVCKAFHVHQQQ
ncbi:unnamed protein product [Rotaria magnacalcarata]|uniref:LysM domain-containing protein n=1 Tax=Rotaria magnacalcarata TaxID=392030 RepID=A0A816D5E3_9BILA|nr:unnamed protein product [Rotaria magnacalcarata]CAF1629868.1 unnamed protein product [Rotaria magnacalcarata]